jgi:phosphoesterase RecJ-like protein
MDEQLQGAIKSRLKNANEILLTSHVRPDGDAVGSVLGLGLALQQAGKKVKMVLADGVPSAYRHLDGADQVKTRIEGTFDTFIALDCADFKRTGKPFELVAKPDINIDHHVTNEKFGTLNLIEADEVATAAILTKYLAGWGLAVTRPVAAALLTGIITDTLGFRTANVTADALRQAATLMETGLDMPELYMRALVRRSYPAARYWGAGLTNLQQQHGMVWSSLTLADRKATGYSGNDDADLINIISSVNGSRVGLVFVEQAEQHVKVSWRALESGIDVSKVAQHFNGGGHAAAAGADIPGGLEETRTRVLSTTREMLGL